MTKEKKKLLYSSIFMLVYLLFNIVYEFISNGKIDTGISSIFIFTSSIIGIILFLFYSLNKRIDLKNHRVSIFIFSILFFLYNIVSGVLSFIVFKNIDKREKRELPNLEINFYHKKYLYIVGFLICMFVMFILSNFVTGKMGLLLIYLSVTTITILMFYKDLISNLKIFKEYFHEYNSFVLKTFLKSLLCLMVINLSIRITTGVDTSTNQEALNTMFETSPFLVAFLSVIYAPIVEECLFRGVFKKVIKNEYLFIFLSGFLFGLMHVIDDFQSVGDFLYVFSYSSLGIFLAYTYNKTNNLWCDIYFHFLQNSFAVLAMFMLTFIK